MSELGVRRVRRRLVLAALAIAAPMLAVVIALLRLRAPDSTSSSVKLLELTPRLVGPQEREVEESLAGELRSLTPTEREFVLTATGRLKARESGTYQAFVVQDHALAGALLADLGDRDGYAILRRDRAGELQAIGRRGVFRVAAGAATPEEEGEYWKLGIEKDPGIILLRPTGRDAWRIIRVTPADPGEGGGKGRPGKPTPEYRYLVVTPSMKERFEKVVAVESKVYYVEGDEERGGYLSSNMDGLPSALDRVPPSSSVYELGLMSSAQPFALPPDSPARALLALAGLAHDPKSRSHGELRESTSAQARKLLPLPGPKKADVVSYEFGFLNNATPFLLSFETRSSYQYREARTVRQLRHHFHLLEPSGSRTEIGTFNGRTVEISVEEGQAKAFSALDAYHGRVPESNRGFYVQIDPSGSPPLPGEHSMAALHLLKREGITGSRAVPVSAGQWLRLDKKERVLDPAVVAPGGPADGGALVLRDGLVLSTGGDELDSLVAFSEDGTYRHTKLRYRKDPSPEQEPAGKGAAGTPLPGRSGGGGRGVTLPWMPPEDSYDTVLTLALLDTSPGQLALPPRAAQLLGGKIANGFLSKDAAGQHWLSYAEAGTYEKHGRVAWEEGRREPVELGSYWILATSKRRRYLIMKPTSRESLLVHEYGVAGPCKIVESKR